MVIWWPRQRCYSTYLARSLYLSIWWYDHVLRRSLTSSREPFATWRAFLLKCFSVSFLTLFSWFFFSIFFFVSISNIGKCWLLLSTISNMRTLIKQLFSQDAYHLPQKWSHCLYIVRIVLKCYLLMARYIRKCK